MRSKGEKDRERDRERCKEKKNVREKERQRKRKERNMKTLKLFKVAAHHRRKKTDNWQNIANRIRYIYILERDRESDRDRESVRRKDGHENITRNQDLVYYYTKVNNLQGYSIYLKIPCILNSML